MSEPGFRYSGEVFDRGSVKETLPRNLASPFEKALSEEVWTPDHEAAAWPPPVMGAASGMAEASLESPFDGEDEGNFESALDSGQRESFESASIEGNFDNREFDDLEDKDSESPDFEGEDFAGEDFIDAPVGRCSHCGMTPSREAPEFEHDVAVLSSATRDYSLKDIADKDNLSDDIRAAILRDGEVDVYDLANRAFKAVHPEITGPLEKTGKRHEKLRLEYGAIAQRVRALIWLRQVVDELDKHRGTLPRDFLLGWMSVESDGRVSVVTSRPERGYFQIDWLAGEAREQLGLSAIQFKKLSTDRAFSIEKGIALVERYRQWVRSNYPTVPDGSEILWRLTKCRHAASGALKSVLDSLVKRKVAISWSNVSPEAPGFMRNNVNATLDYATKLKPFADLVGSAVPATTGPAPTAPAPTPELFAQFLADEEAEDEAFETASSEAEEYSDSGDSEWYMSRETEEEADFEDQPLQPGFAHETLPFAAERDGSLEEFQTPAPRSLVLLDHQHLPKTVSTSSPGTFNIGSLTLLKTDDLNPLFVDASDNLVTDTSPTGLQTCLKALITSKYQDLLGSKGQTAPSLKDRIRVAVVDLTGNKLTAPDFAGWGSTVPIYGASVPKILALYGAFQLRSDLREMITRLSPAGGVQLEKEAIKEWKAKGGRAPWPDLNWLFDIRKWTPSTTLDFTSAAQSTFKNIMHNCPAGTLIAKVSLPFIGSLTWQSALFHGTRSGLWLKSAYCGKGSWASPVKAPYSANVTALAAATYFTLLAQGRLVDDASAKDIATALAGGCVTSLFPALPVVASKCGLWGGYVHDTAWIQDSTARYAIAVMSKLETKKHSTLYTQLCTDTDQLIRNNNKTPKTPC